VRAVLFSNEMLGLGHLRRSLVLAEAIVATGEGSTALVVTGSPAAGVLRAAPGVDLVKVPTAPVTAESSWGATDRRAPGLAAEPAEVVALRSRLAAAVVDELRPDVVLVDFRPLGRMRDLVVALELVRRRGGCTVAFGTWEVDDVGRHPEGWSPEVVEDAARLYDLAFIYGPHPPDDLRVATLRAAGVPIHVTDRVAVAPAASGPSDLEDGYLLVTAGGGVDGFPLLDAVLRAIRTTPIRVPTLLVTGPLMPEPEAAELRERAEGLDARVIVQRSDMDRLLAGARASISMAGYNTTAEVLASGTPALLVPRAVPVVEQLNRARILADEGRVAMLHPDDLDPAAVRPAIDELLARARRPPEAPSGAAEVAGILAAATAAAASD
jgi:predicted glycosyltransferase